MKIKYKSDNKGANTSNQHSTYLIYRNKGSQPRDVSEAEPRRQQHIHILFLFVKWIRLLLKACEKTTKPCQNKPLVLSFSSCYVCSENEPRQDVASACEAWVHIYSNICTTFNTERKSDSKWFLFDFFLFQVEELESSMQLLFTFMWHNNDKRHGCNTSGVMFLHNTRHMMRGIISDHRDDTLSVSHSQSQSNKQHQHIQDAKCAKCGDDGSGLHTLLLTLCWWRWDSGLVHRQWYVSTIQQHITFLWEKNRRNVWKPKLEMFLKYLQVCAKMSFPLPLYLGAGKNINSSMHGSSFPSKGRCE